MYSLISKAVGWLLGINSPDKEDYDGRSLPSILSQSSKDHNCSPDSLHFGDAPFVIQTNEEIETSTVDGSVTHIFHGHGLIDGDIYFCYDDISGGKDLVLKVGDQVLVTAVRLHKDGGWYAKQVVVKEQCWATDDKKPQEIDLHELQKSVIVGKVTSFTKDVGCIDNDITFTLRDCDDGFVPSKGDWVSAFVTEKVEDKSDANDWDESKTVTHKFAYQINPLRVMEIEGQITAIMADHGYINSEIYFATSVCVNGFRPRKNDIVTSTCVETTHGRCQWRSTRVVPLSRNADAHRSKKYNRSANSKTSSSWLVPGQKPKHFSQNTILPAKVPHFSVPENLADCVRDQRELTDFAPYLMKELCFSNYVRRMSTLLHLEEIQMDMDIREFDLFRVSLHHVGEYLALTVPGLAEGRPSVLIGDRVILTIPHDPEGPSYEGYVHELTSTDVHLKFSPEFHCRYNDEDYDVIFTFSRMPLRRSHQAVSLAVQYLGSSVLFPSIIDVKEPQVKMKKAHALSDACQNQIDHTGHGAKFSGPHKRFNYNKPLIESNGSPHHHPSSNSFNHEQFAHNSPRHHPHRIQNSDATEKDKDQCYKIFYNSDNTLYTEIKFFNLHLNTEQKEAVGNILLGQSTQIPYVIFGPPGTGKTITVVEAILQVFSRVPSGRILACAPSNSAADLIMERLHQSGIVSQKDAVRLNAFHRSLEAIPENILMYCRFAEDLQRISRYRIIVSTCIMAGSLYGLGLSPGHFTHIFVDECGQATEPECLIPVGLLSGTDGQIVLAGDPKQLGPIIMSPFAKMYGLEMSLLERLMNRVIYQRDADDFVSHSGFNPLVVTMLVKNYRSHPSILALPSQLFYYNQLQPCANSALVNSLCDWKLLPAAGHPVIFHGLRGDDMRETTSPSWFNPGEALQVVTYLQGLLNHEVAPEDIGVITPYRKQVDKIRLMIERLGMPNMKVGSVEEFQGQERQAIIISTVRSNERMIGFDVRHTLGFLSNPKRFNVAITRAQALLIVVGNPHVLAQDESWRIFIQRCYGCNGYTGCEPPQCITQKEVNN